MSDDEADLMAWRERRLAALVAPDGWLSVVGLHWLSEGRSRIGAAEDNDLVIPQLTAHAGTVLLAPDGAVRIDLRPDAGADFTGEKLLLADTEPGGPTLVRFGAITLHVIKRADGKALRIRDADNPARLQFPGIENFPVDPAWRIQADWVALENPRDFEIESLAGGSNTITVHHKAVFTHEGRTAELWPTHGSAEAPMFVLRDATSGKQTYGACRFLTGAVEGDKVVLDFNRAISPPCAFTDFATCPLPPPENLLPMRIEAGELYRAHS